LVTVKLDRDGDTVWTRRLDFHADDIVENMVVDHSNNVVVTGWAETYAVDPGVCVLVKYSPAGDLVWARTYRFGPETYGGGVDVDRWGNIFVAGCDVDTVSGTRSGRCLVMKCDSMGDTIWTWRYRPRSSGRGLKLDNAGHIYVFGGADNGSDNDILVMKLRYQAGVEDDRVAWGQTRSPAVRVISPMLGSEPVRVRVSSPGDYRVDVFDALGRRAGVPYHSPLGSGEHCLPVGRLPAGVYSVRITAGARTTSRTLVVID